MKTKWNYSNYGNDLRLTTADAIKCSHSGDCETDIREVIKKPYIKKQLTSINKKKLIKELREYGSWDDKELQNHEMNIIRWIWISAADIMER